MLLSLACIFLFGFFFGELFQKIKLPRLLGMLLSGIMLGPSYLNLIDQSVLHISKYLKEIALIIILTRAGLSLDINDLRKVGRPVFFLCFVPATFEIIGMLIFAPLLLGITRFDSAILGTVIAAVSPAIIVPKMIKIQNEKYGINKKIPQMILTGASVDDIYVIILFTITTNIALGNSVNLTSLCSIPISIGLGILIGFFVGQLLSIIFSKIHIRDTTKVILMLSVSFLLLTLEEFAKGYIQFSGLLAIMTSSMILLLCKPQISKRLEVKYSKMWIAAEVLLFVLIGTNLNISYITNTGINIFLLIILALLFRLFGVFISMTKTTLLFKEKLFCMLAYIPKATVQAAIASLPLNMGLACGNMVLSIAILSIIITAPLGSLLIDLSYKKLLQQ